MACRHLNITVISVKDLNVLDKMDVYVVLSLSSDGSNNCRLTPIHKGGSTNPKWGHTLVFPFDEAADRVGLLQFKIMAKLTLHRDEEIGEVDVPVGELLRKGGVDDGEPKVLSYGVRLLSGETKGVLEFSYEFPLAKKAGEPLMGFPAVEAPSASNWAAAYWPPAQRAASYPPPAVYQPQSCGYLSNAASNYGYPPQGYGNPPAGYRYAAPPPAYQKPPKKNGGKNFVLGPAGKFGVVLLIKEMISNVCESVNDAGYVAGLDDGIDM